MADARGTLQLRHFGTVMDPSPVERSDETGTYLYESWRDTKKPRAGFPAEFRDNYFGADKPFYDREAALGIPGSYQGFAVVSNRRVYQVSFPSFQRGELVGSLSDVLDEPKLVCLPSELWNKWVVTVVSPNKDKSEHEHLFPTLPGVKPDVVPGPVVNGSHRKPSLQRLGRDVRENPHFTLMPVFLPIPQGTAFPDGHRLDEELELRDNPDFPELEMWRRGMCWLHNKAQGISCHWHENVVFDSKFLEVDDAMLSRFEFAPADVLGTTNIGIKDLMCGDAVYPSCKAYIVLRTEEAWQRLAVLKADDKKRKAKPDDYDQGFLKAKRQLTEADVVVLSGKMPYDEDKKERICLKHAMVKQACEYGKTCKHAHVTREEFLNQRERKPFIEKEVCNFVESNSGDVTYADGCVPPESTVG
jgi:hypothetical protein